VQIITPAVTFIITEVQVITPTVAFTTPEVEVMTQAAAFFMQAAETITPGLHRFPKMQIQITQMQCNTLIGVILLYSGKDINLINIL
jgi:hypothetical protein